MRIEEQVILRCLTDELYLNEIDTTSIDWVNVADILVEKRLMLLLYTDIKKYISDKIVERYNIIYKKIYWKVKKQVNEVKIIQKKFSDLNIKALFIKGIFLSKVINDNFYTRQCNDIDILVDREDMIKAYNCVYDMGYRFLNRFDKNNMPKLSDKPDFLYGDNYHEFRCLREDEDGSYILIEIKYATSAIPYKYIQDFKSSYQIIDVEGVNVKTFDVVFTFLHICAHLYVNSQCEDGYINDRMFRDFVDLKKFLCNYKCIDWKYIYEKARKYEIIHQVYFALHSVNELWNNTVSKEIIEYFDLHRITYNYTGNEFGEIYTWKNDIVTRCFNEKLRLKEFSSLYKTEIFNNMMLPVIVDDGRTHFFRIEKNAIQIPVFISYDSFCSCIRLVLLFPSKYFEEENLYFFITLTDNDMSKELIERNISNSPKISYTNLTGTWETYVHYEQGINFVNIKTENIFSDSCDKVCILIDLYKNLGNGGFRGTGAKAKYIICNTII